MDEPVVFVVSNPISKDAVSTGFSAPLASLAVTETVKPADASSSTSSKVLTALAGTDVTATAA